MIKVKHEPISEARNTPVNKIQSDEYECSPEE